MIMVVVVVAAVAAVAVVTVVAVHNVINQPFLRHICFSNKCPKVFSAPLCTIATGKIFKLVSWSYP